MALSSKVALDRLRTKAFCIKTDPQQHPEPDKQYEQAYLWKAFRTLLSAYCYRVAQLLGILLLHARHDVYES